MPRTPLRLSGPTQLTNAAVTQYTVPASTKTIVRHIHVVNTTAGPVTVTASIGVDAAAKEIFAGKSIPANDFIDHYCYYVLEAAEVIQAFAGASTSLTMTIDGDQITLG